MSSMVWKRVLQKKLFAVLLIIFKFSPNSAFFESVQLELVQSLKRTELEKVPSNGTFNIPQQWISYHLESFLFRVKNTLFQIVTLGPSSV